MKRQTMMMMMIVSAKTGKNCVEPRNTISKAPRWWIAMWQHETVEELCEKFRSTRSVEEEDENEQEMVLSFAETYKALKKVKRFSMRKVEVTRTMATF
jgi:hypothetical protein